LDGKTMGVASGSPLNEMSFREGPAGSTFQIPLERSRADWIRELDASNHPPGAVFGGVHRAAGVMYRETAIEVFR
jgi:hypothetical protein